MKHFLLLSTLLITCASIHGSYDSNSTKENFVEHICSPTECYTVIKELGEGAFGKVFAVEDSQGKSFAIKTYKNPLDPSNPNFYYTDAEREFSRGQLLNHPNIIKSYDLFMSQSDEEIANIVLDLVKGQTIYKTEKGTITNWSNPAAQFVDAMQYALSMDLMHLDLHGNNVMLDDQTNIKVIDLASFFTLDEIYGFIAQEISKENKTSSSSSDTSAASLSKAVYLEATPEEPNAISLVPLRAAKLQNFFDKNPRLLVKIKEKFKESEQSSISSETKRSKSASKSLYKSSGPNKSSSVVDYASIDLSPMQSHYFDRITEICVRLVHKSELSRDQKIELRAKMKKIVWNYDEDIEDGIKYPLSTYIEQLLNVLQEK